MSYRKVDRRFWKDEKVRALDPTDRLVALYLFTGQANRIGLFAFSPGMAAEDTGLDLDTFRERCRMVCKALGWTWDEQAGVLYLPTWWKYDPPEYDNHLIGSLKDLTAVPRSPLFDLFSRNLRHLAPKLHATFTRTIAERYSHPSPNDPPNHTPSSSSSRSRSSNQQPSAADAASASVAVEAEVLGVEQNNGHRAGKSKTPKRREVDPPGFAEVWAAYPEHEDRAQAVKRFREMPADVTVEMLLASIARWKDSDRWARGFVPYLSRWLKEKRWEAEPRAASGLSAKTSGNLDAARRAAERIQSGAS